MAQCKHRVWEPACPRCKPLSIERDQAWRNFRYTFKPGQTKEIHSKRQFLRECAASGQRWVSSDDLLHRGQPYHAGNQQMSSGTIRPIVDQVIAESKDQAKVERAWRNRRKVHA